MEEVKRWMEEGRVRRRGGVGEGERYGEEVREEEQEQPCDHYEYILLEEIVKIENVLREQQQQQRKDLREDIRRSSLHKDSRISVMIISMILQWRKKHSKLFLFSSYREYFPLITLTGDAAILPLQILTLQSYEPLSIRRERIRSDLNLVSIPLRFEDIRNQIRGRDFFFSDKLEFVDCFRYGALFLKQSLQAAVFISASNLYIYHPLDCLIDSIDLRELLVSVMNDWMESFGKIQNVTPFVAIIRAEDRDLEMVLSDIGFQIPEDSENPNHSNLIDEIVLFPASFATQSSSPNPPNEIYLLMGQSNMSGRGPLFGPTGILPESCLESRNFRSTLQAVQNEFTSSLFDSAPPVSQYPLDVDVFDDQETKETKLLMKYSDSYADRILSYDIRSMTWRYPC